MDLPLISLIVLVVGALVILFVSDKYSRRCPKCRVRWAIRTTEVRRKDNPDDAYYHELYACKHCGHEVWLKHRT